MVKLAKARCLGRPRKSDSLKPPTVAALTGGQVAVEQICEARAVASTSRSEIRVLNSSHMEKILERIDNEPLNQKAPEKDTRPKKDKDGFQVVARKHYVV